MVCKECSRKHYAKGLCQKHYIREWQKSDKYKDWRRKKEYKSVVYMHKKRFGGIREKIIKRDGEKCVECGMTREEHKERWGMDITVNHIDGNGRYSSEQNNDESNLETLCLACHGSKDSKRFWRAR